MSSHRVSAVVLFAVGFLALAASKAFPFLDDVPGAVETGIAIFGAACLLGGVRQWFHKTPDVPQGRDL
ncbi:hypothetical protein [Actinoplanes sp. N902-109]|uniref:hypothetical protein n=1 Tax=Actinoplanes sp. (strain N902-109) TaxID=649831 RepID=UPI0003294178|nr:hypothetical protein [Actinoplanes sp. N902-109]AGL20068.1 hypothetical protein L083_6558 [Actinoplanes sp. N902-109]